MSQPLISAGNLIKHSWKMVRDHWRGTLLYTVLLFALPFLIALVGTPITLSLALQEKISLLWLWSVFYAIVVMVVVTWPSLKLIRYVLEKDLGHAVPSPEKEVSLPLILSFFWVSILTIVCVGLGYIALIIPGIWLAGLLAFGTFYLLEDNKKGTEALKASAKLVKGRWWAVFGRMLLVGLFIMAVYIVLAIVIGILNVVLISTLGDSMIGQTLSTIINLAIQIVMTVAATLFVLSAQIKLFHNLKETPAPQTKP